MTKEETAALLAGAIESAKKSVWTKTTVPNYERVVSYTGTGAEWRIIAIEATEEGYCDGAISKEGLVVHLPHDTARDIVKIAKENIHA